MLLENKILEELEKNICLTIPWIIKNDLHKQDLYELYKDKIEQNIINSCFSSFYVRIEDDVLLQTNFNKSFLGLIGYVAKNNRTHLIGYLGEKILKEIKGKNNEK